MNSKEYDIFTYEQFEVILKKYIDHFRIKKNTGKEFSPMTVAFKNYRKKKTSKQHSYYWACINELKKALHEAGCVYNQAQIHEMIKLESGFTEMKTLPNGKTMMTTKSMADNSKDATLDDMKELINFIIIFALENLNYMIRNPMDGMSNDN